MSESRLAAAEQLFTELVDLDEAARETRLAELARTDAELADEVRSLIASDVQATAGFLQPPTGPVEDWSGLEDELLADSGARLGPYRIRELLFEGGMGRVYLADQAEPLQRVVAIKVLAAPWLGEDVVERFRLEQGALASLNHPHVAAIFDAGLTPSGSPWFAMEYVDGTPITRFAEERELDLEQRIALFLQLCGALGHAHERGLIHRDVKPANVLAAEGDEEPVVKLIDFGIAKATGAALVGDRTLTQDGLLLGTPEYMSPEQCGEHPHSVGVRSDVYSAGLVLYELLTGVRAHDWASIRERGLDAVLDAVRHEDPVPPSQRVKLRDELPPDARARLARRLSGELDWIVQAAIAKEPPRRYGSMGALADDLRRRSRHEPVRVGPPSAWYRASRFVKRRALPLAAGTLVTAALMTGGGAASWKAIEAKEDRALAEQSERLMRWNRYASALAATEEALAAGDTSGARRSLDSAPEDLRGWEWRQAWASLEDAEVVAEPHGSVVTELVTGRRFAATASLDGEVRSWTFDGALRRVARSLPSMGPFRIGLQEDAGLAWVASRQGELRPLLLDTLADAGEPFSGLGIVQDLVVLPRRGWLITADDEGVLRRRLLADPADSRVLVPEALGPGLRLAADPEERHLIAGGSDGRLRLVELDTGSTVGATRLGDSAVWSLAIRPDGKELAASDAGGSLVYLELPSLRPRLRQALPAGAATGLAWSPGGELLTSASVDGGLRRWNVESGRLRATLLGHGRGGLLVATWPDEHRLLAAAADGSVRLFDSRSARARRSGPSLPSRPLATWTAPDGRSGWASLLDGRVVSLGPDGAANGSFPVEGRPVLTALAADGARLYAGTADGRVIWADAPGPLPSGGLDACGDGSTVIELASVDGGVFAACWGGRVSELDPEARELRARLAGADCTSSALVADPQGAWLARGCLQGRVDLVDRAGGHRRQLRLGPAVRSLAHHPGTGEFLIGLEDGSIVAADPRNGEETGRLLGHVAPVLALAVAPSGKRFASGAGDGTVRIWSRDFELALTALRPGIGRIDRLRWTGDEDLLVRAGAQSFVFSAQQERSAELAALGSGAAGWPSGS